jgi:hypothetical protein
MAEGGLVVEVVAVDLVVGLLRFTCEACCQLWTMTMMVRKRSGGVRRGKSEGMDS